MIGLWMMCGLVVRRGVMRRRGGVLRLMAGRCFGFGLMQGGFAGQRKARAMLRRGLHLASEDERRGERQHNAGELRKHHRNIVPPATPVNAATGSLPLGGVADGVEQCGHLLALAAIGGLEHGRIHHDDEIGLGLDIDRLTEDAERPV